MCQNAALCDKGLKVDCMLTIETQQQETAFKKNFGKRRNCS